MKRELKTKVDFPKEGFLKISSPERPVLEPAQRSALIRKGNILFNSGKISAAKKIFLTTGYTDGIIRVGDHLYQQGELWEAFRLYQLAPSQSRVSQMVQSMALVLREWLQEAVPRLRN